MKIQVLLKIVLFFSVLMCCSGLCNCFDNNVNCDAMFSKGTILTKNLEKVEAEDICFYSQQIFYTRMGTNYHDSIAFSKVDLVRAHTGNYALIGGGLGGLLGLLVGWQAIINADANNNKIDNKTSVILISTAVGAGIGLIAGAFIPEIRTVFSGGRLNFKPVAYNSKNINYIPYISIVSISLDFK